MSHYKPYPSYKNSGVEWLGEVPEGWEVKPLFSVASERSESNKGMVEDNLLSLSYGRIVQKDINTTNGLLPESFETYQVVRHGDTVFRLTDLQNDKRSLRTGLVMETGIITSAYVAAIPDNIDPVYFNNLLYSYDIQKVFYAMGGGMRQSLKFSDIKRLPIVLPKENEQKNISRYIKSETTRIDTLVQKKTRFIELLKEKRQALITHAVTKGLDPNAKMKDSGFEWLGEVPEGWHFHDFWTIAKPKSITTNEPEPLLSVYLDRGVIPYSEGGGLVHKPADSLEKYQLVEENDFVMNNQQAWRGSVGVSNYRGLVSPAYLIFSFDEEKVHPDFARHFVRDKAYVEQYMLCSLSVGTIQRQIKWPHLKKLKIVLPPIEEQKTISAFIDRETTRIDTLIDKTTRSIDLLKERRSALITAAVTGKIDVRGQVSSPNSEAVSV
jgi:type I restriction enzyme S subunit